VRQHGRADRRGSKAVLEFGVVIATRAAAGLRQIPQAEIDPPAEKVRRSRHWWR